MEKIIKFRGKVLKVIKKYHPCKVGEWAYGDLLHAEHDFIKGVDIITDDFSQVVADENTIGQFTGLKDKNGREIYEGDIIRKTETTYRMTDLGVVRYCNEEAKFVLHVTDKYSEYDFSFVKDYQSQDGNATVPCHNEYEVIGNIYDNPELLKQ